MVPTQSPRVCVKVSFILLLLDRGCTMTGNKFDADETPQFPHIQPELLDRLNQTADLLAKPNPKRRAPRCEFKTEDGPALPAAGRRGLPQALVAKMGPVAGIRAWGGMRRA